MSYIFLLAIIFWIVGKVIFDEQPNNTGNSSNSSARELNIRKVVSFFIYFNTINRKSGSQRLNASIAIKITGVNGKGYIECNSFAIWNSSVDAKSIIGTNKSEYKIDVIEDGMFTIIKGNVDWSVPYNDARYLFREIYEELSGFDKFTITQPWTDLNGARTGWGCIELKI